MSLESFDHRIAWCETTPLYIVGPRERFLVRQHETTIDMHLVLDVQHIAAIENRYVVADLNSVNSTTESKQV